MNFLVETIHALRPGASFALDGFTYEGLQWLEPPVEDGGQEKPTKEEIDVEIKRLRAEYEYNQYQRDRAAAYPSIADQLDLLYHGGYDVWKEEINKVKQQYPKPE